MKKNILGFMIITIVILGISFIYNNFNNDFTMKTVKYDGNNLRISIDGEVSSTLPNSGNYYLIDYDCSNNNTIVTWDNKSYSLSVTNNNKKGNVACYLEFKSTPLLSEMPVGSYVDYTGNNGCSGKSCSGFNANYVSDNNMGYCSNSSYKFHENGWRIAYIENNSAYLISGGAIDCMCTDASGKQSTNNCDSSIESGSDLNKHFNNMNEIALKYCNSTYSNDGLCDDTTAWSMSADDFKKMVGNLLSPEICSGSTFYNNMSCGYTNSLIDNGGYYWIASAFDNTTSNYVFSWLPNYRGVDNSYSKSLLGIRPILYLSSSVVVVGGNGTSDSPYVIAVEQ